jgi:hypothetical protein
MLRSAQQTSIAPDLDDQHERMFSDVIESGDQSVVPLRPSNIVPPPHELQRRVSTEGDVSPRQATSKQSEVEKKPETAEDPDKKILTPQDRFNFFGRWIENARFLGMLLAAIADFVFRQHADDPDHLDKDFENQLDGVVDKIGGVAIGAVMHFFVKGYYRVLVSLNPLYRNFKTLATAGLEVGIVAANVASIPMLLSTTIFSLGFGLIAIPYWLLRDYFLNGKVPIHERNRYFKTGIEGWSKYAKTFLVYGMYLGELFGTGIAYAMRWDLARNIALFGAIGSVATFAAGLVIVPFMNWYFKDKFIAPKLRDENGNIIKDEEGRDLYDRDYFRNNYVRSGITLGIAIGTILGFLAWPSAAGIAMTVGAAFGGVIGGIALGALGARVTLYIQQNWNVKKDTDNSWDYATRNSSYLFGFIGAAIGFFIPMPGGVVAGAALGSSISGAALGTALVGATICGAVASVIGWGLGLLVVRQARVTCEKEQKADTLPWTQRIAFGSMYGSMLGATLGFCMGMILGPAGATMGGTLGFSGGAILGGFSFGLWDNTSRNLIWHFLHGKTFIVVEEGKDEVKTPLKQSPEQGCEQTSENGNKPAATASPAASPTTAAATVKTPPAPIVSEVRTETSILAPAAVTTTSNIITTLGTKKPPPLKFGSPRLTALIRASSGELNKNHVSEVTPVEKPVVDEAIRRKSSAGTPTFSRRLSMWDAQAPLEEDTELGLADECIRLGLINA